MQSDHRNPHTGQSHVFLVMLPSCRASDGMLRMLRLDLHSRQLDLTTNTKSGTHILRAWAQSWQPRSSDRPFAGPGVERAAAGEEATAGYTAIFASSLHDGIKCTQQTPGLVWCSHRRGMQGMLGTPCMLSSRPHCTAALVPKSACTALC
jgi:hypothetical protein